MKRAMTLATAGAAALLLTLTMGVSAQQIDTHDRTIMTFSAPVELPGVTLQPGTYVFKLADTASRNVIQVLSKDEMDVIGHWLFVPAERRDVTGETVVTFRETKEGTTPAVQYWYYPGESIGKEFIYPKDQAVKIAARTGATVKSDEGDVTPQSASATADSAATTSASSAANSDNAANTDHAATADNTVNGSGLPADQPAESTSASAQADATAPAAAPAAAPAPAPAAASQPSRNSSTVGTSGSQSPSATDSSAQRPASTSTYSGSQLPRTASPLPLSGLLGLFSMAGAAGLRRFRR